MLLKLQAFKADESVSDILPSILQPLWSGAVMRMSGRRYCDVRSNFLLLIERAMRR